jgi:hypothetical protein
MLEPRPMQLVAPADAVLRVGVPLVVRWSHAPYDTARRRYDGDCAGFVCVTDSWTSQLPVTLELEPPLPAR